MRDSKVISVSLDPTTVAILDKLAKLTHTTRSGVIKLMVRRARIDDIVSDCETTYGNAGRRYVKPKDGE